MSFNYNSIIDEIKSRCNIVEVIERVVPLKRAGSNFKGNCPFHNEKTPSFVVSETKQIFTCFGCGATGDVIEFVRRYYNLEFMAAVEKLAAEYGIEIKDKDSFKSSENKDLYYQINREAAAFFFRALYKGHNPGYEYMRRRGIDAETLKAFGIGYADDKWTSLKDHLNSKGYDDKTLFTLGLVSEKEGRYYDKFRDRVMFPIMNTSGKVIGFGGRIIGKGEPKYLNSPESPVFLKKNNLYGLNFTRQEVSKENCAILVEGYMDVVSLYQAGVHNVSASLGTALTENQAKLLKRYTSNIVLSYDADSAGQAAALRGIDILHKENCRVKVLHVSDGKDPDEFIKKNGRLAFLKLVDDALPFADYKLKILKEKFPVETTEGMVQFMQASAEVLRELTPVERDIYIKKISEEMKISEGALRLETDGSRADKPKSLYERTERRTDKGQATMPSMLEKNLLKLMMTDKAYFEKLSPYNHAFISESGKVIYEAIKSQIREERLQEFDYKRIADNIDPAFTSTLMDIYENVQFGGMEDKVTEDCIKAIERADLKDRERELLLMLSLADEDENNKNIKELTEELMTIQKLLQ